MIPRRPLRALARRARRDVDEIDERYRVFGRIRKEASRVSPGNHSFFWGRLAFFSFVVLVLSGTVLALYFVPDTTDVTYHGQYAELKGRHMSRAYRSAVSISFEVRGGLLLRQIHHWAALIFLASLMLHMARTFFTGAFRKPRELTWLTGALLLILGLVEGFTGYGMLDDLLSSQSLRIFSGLLLSIPVVGTWLQWMVFGSAYEGDLWASRLFAAHVFLISGLIAALIAVHLALVWRQRHTHFPGPGAREHTIVGTRAVRAFGLRTLAYGLCTAGVLAMMGGLFEIEPVWLWGPYHPSNVSTEVQPDWYIGYVIGALRLFPGWSIHVGGYTVPAPFWPGVVLPMVMLSALAAYPYIERHFTKDHSFHHVLERPRDDATRTAIGAASIAFYMVLFLAGSDDVFAITYYIPIEWAVWAGRVAVFVVPAITYPITKNICLGMQRGDRRTLERGARTGLVREHPDGGFAELLRPPGGVDEEGRPVPMAYGGVRVERRVISGEESRREESVREEDEPTASG